jgi:rubrerythrin
MPKQSEQWKELLYQALETETGGIEIYENAIECAVNDELKEEWQRYLEQTKNHERILNDVFKQLGLDPATETPGRAVVRHLGESLVRAMQMAREQGEEEAAEIVAAECVVLAETKDHANWELLKELADNVEGKPAKVFAKAVDQVEDEEDEHLYHTMGWARELWLDSLGIEAVLPPPEEEHDVKTAVGAARAKANREQELGGTARRASGKSAGSKGNGQDRPGARP